MGETDRPFLQVTIVVRLSYAETIERGHKILRLLSFFAKNVPRVLDSELLR